MPKEKATKTNSERVLSVDSLRWAEYYGLQSTFDELYAKAKEGEKFTDLMDLILSRENILLAYRSIKTNTGSQTPGTDKTTIKDLGALAPDELVDKVRFIVSGSVHGYRPKPVRRKDIPKGYGKGTRPLGIPCMWDRLVQQCIKQVLEPICEAKFSDNSYGFRPQRNAENAISATHKRVQLSHLHYVIEFDIKQIQEKLAEQAKNVARPRPGKKERDEIMLYNAMVMGEQNYFRIATEVNLDLRSVQRNAMTIFTNRLRTQKGSRLAKEFTKVKKRGKPVTTERSGRELTKVEKERYGKSKQLRWIKGSGEPIYPIGYVQHKKPMAKKRSICPYTPEGRVGLHDNLRVNTKLLLEMMKQPLYDCSAEYTDNRLSLFSAQWGRCAVTGIEFSTVSEIHCHHKKLRSNGGSDKYENLVLVLEPVHKLIHAQKPETIAYYLELLKLNPAQLKKVNDLRKQAGILEIESEPGEGGAA